MAVLTLGSSSATPIAKASLTNQALPAAEAAWLGAAISPSNSPSYLQIYVCVSVSGVFRLARTKSSDTQTEDMNAGVALNADAGYAFTVPWRFGDTVNFRYSVTTGTIKALRVDEVGSIS